MGDLVRCINTHFLDIILGLSFKPDINILVDDNLQKSLNLVNGEELLKDQSKIPQLK